MIYIPNLTLVYTYGGLADKKPGEFVDSASKGFLRIVGVKKTPQDNLVVCLKPDADKCKKCIAQPLCGAPVKS